MSVLASVWGPWICIVIVFAAAGLAANAARGRAAGARITFAVVAAMLCGIAMSMSIGAGAMAVRASAIAQARPKDGLMVDVGGARAFVRCDGAKGSVTLVLLPGGYSAGAFMAPLRRALGLQHRACLVDRPGTGFADRAGEDRGVSVVIREIRDAVRGAGEEGALVIIGHSMGGLYAANLAQAFPDEIAGLVLLDPTPPQWFTEQRALYGCEAPEFGLRIAATAFGLGLVPALNPMHGPGSGKVAQALGAEWPLIVDQESRPGALLASVRAGAAACENPFDLVQSPGALGALPILTVVQSRTFPQTAPAALTGRAQSNWRGMRAQWPAAYAALTANGSVVYAPSGEGHLFPVENPQWTAEAIRPFLEALNAAARESDK